MGSRDITTEQWRTFFVALGQGAGKREAGEKAGISYSAVMRAYRDGFAKYSPAVREVYTTFRRHNRGIPTRDELSGNALRALDDFAFILRNPRIMGSDSALGLFTSIHPPDLYRPLTLLTYAVNAAVDARPVLFHLVNVALHVAVSVIVFRLAEVLLGGVEVGAAVGALLTGLRVIVEDEAAAPAGVVELARGAGVFVGEKRTR